MDENISIENINIVIKSVLEGKNKIITYDKFEKIIELFGLYKMKELVGDKDVKFIITDLSDDVGMCCKTDWIKIDRKVIKIIYDGYHGCHAVFMDTIFHELAHFEFNYRILNGIYDDDSVIRVLKEKIINQELGKTRGKLFHKDNKAYYDLNYDVISDEVMADIKAYTNMIIWFKELDINLTYEEVLFLEDEYKEILIKADNKKRNFPGNRRYKAFSNMDVDKVFDTVIFNNPEWLDEFCFLKDDYYVDLNKKVRRRIKE